MFAALDWMPALGETGRGLTGDGLKKQIEAGNYKGFVKTTLDGEERAAISPGQVSRNIPRATFSTTTPAPIACRTLEELEVATTAPRSQGATGWFMPLIPYHWTQLVNLKRDLFEQVL